MTYNGGGGRPGNGWDGHLPSDKMERAILNAMEGIEDEDGKKSAFLNTDEQEVACARAHLERARMSEASHPPGTESDPTRSRTRRRPSSARGATTPDQRACARTLDGTTLSNSCRRRRTRCGVRSS